MTDNEKTEKLQIQSDLLTLGLLAAKAHINAIQKRYSDDVMGTNQFAYPKPICQNMPPEAAKGLYNGCLSCPMAKTCQLLFGDK